MKCDNCEIKIDKNDDTVSVFDPKKNKLQVICIPCDRSIPWQTMLEPKLNKTVKYIGDLI